ncbi:MAG: hypothetical protein K8U57_35945 [Planctomycetes bacterium]|nr:hypothetical protein [Planctomycetota bacterium]
MEVSTAQEVIETAAKAHFFDRLIAKYGQAGVLALLEAEPEQEASPKRSIDK